MIPALCKQPNVTAALFHKEAVHLARGRTIPARAAARGRARAGPSGLFELLLDAIAELANHDNDNSAQSAFILLRHSAAHKFTHLLRSAPPSLIEEAALAYDTSMTDCLAKILDRSSRDLFTEGSSPD